MDTGTREHKSSGLTASLGLSWSGLSAGVGYQKSVDRITETTKTIVPNKTNVAGEVRKRQHRLLSHNRSSRKACIQCKWKRDKHTGHAE